MNSYHRRELWFKIRLTLAYLGLGVGSALIAVNLSHPFGEPGKTIIKLTVFLGILYLIEIKVERTPVKEEGS